MESGNPLGLSAFHSLFATLQMNYIFQVSVTVTVSSYQNIRAYLVVLFHILCLSVFPSYVTLVELLFIYAMSYIWITVGFTSQKNNVISNSIHT